MKLPAISDNAAMNDTDARLPAISDNAAMSDSDARLPATVTMLPSPHATSRKQ